jgi:uncharacterized OB-fold protein
VEKPVPVPTAETRPFWEGCRRGELLYQYCRACGRAQFYPRALCAGCQGGGLEWRCSSGRGSIHSFTVVHRAPSEAFKTEVPYALALVDLEEGFRMMLNVRGADPESLRIGQPVRIVFEPRGKLMLPQAEPAE